MRRTRHVVLPVKSWQYIGLLLVSLACLTLGHVSRDREGRAGSLAGPELKHTAPHEVDACPNGDLSTPRLLSNGELALAEKLKGTLTRESQLFEHPRRIRERVIRESRRVVERSVNIRDLGSRMVQPRSSNTGDIRAAEENRRLITLQDSRSERRRSLHRSDDRRLVSLGRRVSESNQIRASRGELFTSTSRLFHRESSGTRSSGHQCVASREGKCINRIDGGWIPDIAHGRVRSTNRMDMEDHNVRNLEAREQRINAVELIVERRGSTYPTDFQRSAEKRETNSAERRERVRRISMRLSERSLRNRNLQYVNNSRRSRINMERFNVRSDERIDSINRFSTLSLDRQKRSIPFMSERIRLSPLNKQQSSDWAEHRNMDNRERFDSTKWDTYRAVPFDESLTSEKINTQRLRVRYNNRPSPERLQTHHSVRQERFTRKTTEVRRSSIEADYKRFADRLQMRDSNRQTRLTKEKIDIRRSDVELNDRQSANQLQKRDLERKELVSRDRRTADREDFRSEIRESSERRKIRMPDRHNNRADRVEQSTVQRIRSHSITRRKISWKDSLSRSDAILRAPQVSDVDRRPVERLTREDRRISRQENREKTKEKQVVRVDNKRDNDRNRVNKNYLATVPYLINNKIADNQNYELLREIFVLALCTIYTASIFQTKSGYVKNTLTEAARFLVW